LVVEGQLRLEGVGESGRGHRGDVVAVRVGKVGWSGLVVMVVTVAVTVAVAEGVGLSMVMMMSMLKGQWMGQSMRRLSVAVAVEHETVRMRDGDCAVGGSQRDRDRVTMVGGGRAFLAMSRPFRSGSGDIW
jgi:hypothetical protein